MIYVQFGRRVRLARKKLGITQAELAKRIGLSRTSITNIERGRQKVLLHQIFELAGALGSSIDALLPDDPVENGSKGIEEIKGFDQDMSQKEIRWMKSVIRGTSAGKK